MLENTSALKLELLEVVSDLENFYSGKYTAENVKWIYDQLIGCLPGSIKKAAQMIKRSNFKFLPNAGQITSFCIEEHMRILKNEDRKHAQRFFNGQTPQQNTSEFVKEVSKKIMQRISGEINRMDYLRWMYQVAKERPKAEWKESADALKEVLKKLKKITDFEYAEFEQTIFTEFVMSQIQSTMEGIL